MTPMLEQYFAIKKQYPNEIVLFRLGDFYEMFGSDAVNASKILDIALTARYKNTENEIPMCGVPHHAAEGYIAKLTNAGLRVAMCDQTSDPKLPGLVERGVSRVITPGTTLSDEVIFAKQNNYLVTIVVHATNTTPHIFGLACVDLTTGEFRVTELATITELSGELQRLRPSEVLISETLKKRAELEIILRDYHLNCFVKEAWQESEKVLKQHFKIHSLHSFGLESFKAAIDAAAFTILYLMETQKQGLEHMNKIQYYSTRQFMLLDEFTIRNLELFTNTQDNTAKNTLIELLDDTMTTMGGRKLRQWMLRPLQDVTQIEERLESVDEFVRDSEKRGHLRQLLKHVSDIERLLARVGCMRASPKDIVAVKESLLFTPVLKQLLGSCSYEKLTSLGVTLPEHREVIRLIDSALVPEPPFLLTEGGFIKPGFDVELDELRRLSSSGKEWLRDLQEQERKRTGISSLKVGFNNVFGYYIEISKSNFSLAPAEYIRKQTLTNAERFITPELKEYEEKILGAEEKMQKIEYELFQKLLGEIKPFIAEMQITAQIIASLDVILALAEVAYTRRYTKPILHNTGRIMIKDGRHPVIESLQKEFYIPNSLYLDHDQQQLIILTGPNMSGKSSYIRQNALIVLMAHMGSFVPASYAEVTLTDRVFTRVGASDNLTLGQSTFMMEMQQAANIITNATEHSFIIFDELGRGTSTYDGVSIAWAIAKYVHDVIGAKTLFATHYHELIRLAEVLPKAKNYSIKVKESDDGEVVFLHEVVEGGVNKSYGIEVAKLAGLPAEVIARARKILEQLSAETIGEVQDVLVQEDLVDSTTTEKRNFISARQQAILNELVALDLFAMTPLDALKKLAEWQK